MLIRRFYSSSGSRDCIIETFKTKVLRDPLFQQKLALVAIVLRVHTMVPPHLYNTCRHLCALCCASLIYKPPRIAISLFLISLFLAYKFQTIFEHLFDPRYHSCFVTYRWSSCGLGVGGVLQTALQSTGCTEKLHSHHRAMASMFCNTWSSNTIQGEGTVLFRF